MPRVSSTEPTPKRTPAQKKGGIDQDKVKIGVAAAAIVIGLILLALRMDLFSKPYSAAEAQEAGLSPQDQEAVKKAVEQRNQEEEKRKDDPRYEPPSGS